MPERETSNSEILINTLYTGDYTNKNIGHEIINLYKPDNGNKIYIYITPYGFFDIKKHKNIPTILLTKSAGANLTEVIAKIDCKDDEQVKLADGIDESLSTEPKFTYQAKLLTNTSAESKKEAFKKIKNLLKNGDKILIKLEKKYTEWMQKQTKTIEESTNKKTNIILTHPKSIKFNDKGLDIFTKKFLNDIGVSDKIFEEINEINISYNNEIDNKDFDNIKQAYIKWRYKYLNWLAYRTINHLKQIKYIVDKDIKYNGILLHKILQKNLYNNQTLLVTYEVAQSAISQPKKKLYLKTINNSANKKQDKKTNEDNINVEEKLNIKFEKHIEKVNSDIFEFEGGCFRNQKCYSFQKFPTKKIENVEDIEKIENTEDAFNYIINKKSLWTNKLKTVKEDSKEEKSITFIDIMGKQFDELAYSNMFAYFFTKYPNLFVSLMTKINGLKNIKIDNIFEVKREEANIDLIIATDAHLFVIENKIKAKIHGEKYDPQTDYYTNQLIKYYDYIEDKYKKQYGNNIFYNIWKPNYNDILLDNIAKEHKIKQDDINKIKSYKIIDYSEIVDNIEETNDKYYKEFLDSLNLHTSDNNLVETDMKRKFIITINNANNGEKNNDKSNTKIEI